MKLYISCVNSPYYVSLAELLFMVLNFLKKTKQINALRSRSVKVFGSS
jgi:hypothetical protein